MSLRRILRRQSSQMAKDTMEDAEKKPKEELKEDSMVERFEKKLKKSDNPLNFLPLLLSPEPKYMDKLRILWKIPVKGYRKIDDMEKLERLLNRAGYPELAALADIEGRRIVQREIYVQEEMRALHKALDISPDDTSQLDAWERELKDLNEQYWANERKLWLLEANIPAGPLQRAFTALRKGSILVSFQMAAQGLCRTKQLLWKGLRML